MDSKALFNIGYGLYVLSTRDGQKDNGCIINTVMQVTANPVTIAIGVNKQNYSTEILQKTKKCNLSLLTEETPFSIFKRFGFCSGRTVNKFENEEITRTANGLSVINEYSNSVLSLSVLNEIDMGTHVMFICTLDDAEILSPLKSLTYAFYQSNIKPKPVAVAKETVWRCNICNYEHKGENLPDDFICPICKHTKADFTKIN